MENSNRINLNEITQFVIEKVNIAFNETLKDKIALAVGAAIHEQLTPALKIALIEISQQTQQQPPTRELLFVNTDAVNADNLPSPERLPPLSLSDGVQNEPRSLSHSEESEERRDCARTRAPPESRDSNISPNPLHNDLPQFLRDEKPPSFNKKLMSPPQYINALKEYFDVQNIYSDISKLACARYGLKRHCENWFDIHSDKLVNFQDFERYFFDDMWSERDQLYFRNTIFAEEFRSIKKYESLVDFFESNYAKAVNHFPLMTFEELKLKFLAKITRVPDLDLLIANCSNYDSLKNILRSYDSIKPVGNSYKSTASSSKKNSSSKRTVHSTKENGYRFSYSNNNAAECSTSNHHVKNRFLPYRQRNKHSRNYPKKKEHGVFHLQENSPDPSAQSRRYYQKRRLFRNSGGSRQWNGSYQGGVDSREKEFDFTSDFEEKVTFTQ